MNTSRPRQVTPIAALTRTQLCGRIHALRAAMDLLVDQQARDGGEGYLARGPLTAERIELECEARAFGAEVVLFTTSPGKTEDAKRLGAHEVVISRDPAAMAAHANSFDFIPNTVAASHNLDPFIGMLKRDGTICMVGAPEHPHPSPGVLGLIFPAPPDGRLAHR